jgi:hypothetical protein
MRPTSTTLAIITATAIAGLSAACGPRPTASPGVGGTPGIGGTSGVGGSSGVGGGPSTGSCPGMAPPATADYGGRGPFNDVRMIPLTGPGAAFTMFRPMASLGQNGFKHPVATWGNGIITTPDMYTDLLLTIASHGFVVIGSNSTQVSPQQMTQGLDWLIQQNSAAGDLNGKLAVNCAATIGYSWGGMGAVNAGSHQAVKVVVSMHGLQGAAENVRGPLLLFTSTSDGFVTKSGYVQPTYNRSSRQPTILATLNVPGAPADFLGHLIPLGNAGEERAPMVAWLRYWMYGDQGAAPWFYGPSCRLCTAPWTGIQRKNHSW